MIGELKDGICVFSSNEILEEDTAMSSRDILSTNSDFRGLIRLRDIEKINKMPA